MCPGRARGLQAHPSLVTAEAPARPLQPYITNVVARRRAVKVLCEVHKSEKWGSIWLSRLWKFWGHVFRSSEGLPLHLTLDKCSTWRVVSGRTAAGIVKPLISRKLQLAWDHLRGRSPFASIESLAKDREAWLAALPLWLGKWGHQSSDIAKLPNNYLHDRQLLLVGSTLAVLRPARVFPEEPYSRELQHILPGNPNSHQWTVWGRMLQEGVCVTLIPPAN